MDEDKLKALKDEFHQEYPEFVQFLTTHGGRIVTGILLGAAIYLGIQFFMGNHKGSIEKAAVALAQAKSVEDLEEITVDYKSTPSAALAYMSIAKIYFNSGDYDSALSKYMELQTKFPGHPLALSVELNRISCFEARGQVQEALADYEDFMKKNPDHYLTSEALFGKGRCLEKMGQWNDAKALYEDYLVKNPKGVWFSRAEDALKVVDRQLATVAQPAKEG